MVAMPTAPLPILPFRFHAFVEKYSFWRPQILFLACKTPGLSRRKAWRPGPAEA